MKISNKIGYDSNTKIPKSKSAKKKDVSDVLTDKNIEKMRQIAYNDAIKGKRGHEATIFRNQCREQVAPDRKMIFSNAEKGMSAEINKFKNPTNIWIYLLEADGHFDGGAFKGNYTKNYAGTGYHTFIEAFDKNGEKVGIYDSNYGWRIKQTSAEKQVMAVLSSVYNETFNSVYRTVHKSKNKSDALAEIKSTLDIKV